MELFEQVLLEQLINKHSTHIEELIFTKGKQSIDIIVDGISEIVDKINDNSGPLSTKIDGCVHKNTLVVTTKGPKKISELTNDDFVKTYDLKTGKIIFFNNTLPRITGRNKSWVTVYFNNHGRLKCTSDHPILMLSKRYVSANELERKPVFCLTSNSNQLYVDRVVKDDGKYDQWDLTTHTGNFVINVDDDEIVVHNSPAVFVVNGDNGVGVATKSFFNVSPKINYTEQDIDKNHTGTLAKKLKVALKYLPSVIPPTRNVVYQGDMLFTDDLRYFTKDGVKLIGFHPNTIVYTVDAEGPTGKQIAQAKIGIAFHTQYKWDGLNPATAEVTKFGISKDIFKDNPNVFIIDTISNFDNKSTKFDKNYDSQFNEIRTLGNNIQWELLEQPLVSQTIMTFINTHFRENKQMQPPIKRAQQLFDYIDNVVEKTKQTKKTQKGKDAVDTKYADVLALKDHKATMINLMKIFDIVTSIKLDIIHFVDRMSTFNNFVIDSSGNLIATGQEGYVITQTSAKGVKLVDRYNFATNNFSKNIIKSWMHSEDKR